MQPPAHPCAMLPHPMPSLPPTGPTGLLYDRCWALVDPSGSALRLKQHPALARVTATVDLERRLLVVTAAGEAEQLEVPLPGASGAQAQPCAGSSGSCTSSNCTGSGGGSSYSSGNSSSSSGGGREPFSVRVCSRTAWVERSAAATSGDAAASAWFSRVVGTPCRLVQQAQQAQQAQPAEQTQQAGQAQQSAAGAARGRRAGFVDAVTSSSSDNRSFANEGHLLLLGAASLADLAHRAGSSETADVFAQRFRWVLADAMRLAGMQLQSGPARMLMPVGPH